MLPEKQREADANRESFADLAKEVRLYKEKIQSAVTRAETRLVQDIQNAENQKTQIKMDIERYLSFTIAVGANAADGMLYLFVDWKTRYIHRRLANHNSASRPIMLTYSNVDAIASYCDRRLRRSSRRCCSSCSHHPFSCSRDYGSSKLQRGPLDVYSDQHHHDQTSALTAVAKAIQYMKLKKEHTGLSSVLCPCAAINVTCFLREGR